MTCQGDESPIAQNNWQGAAFHERMTGNSE